MKDLLLKDLVFCLIKNTVSREECISIWKNFDKNIDILLNDKADNKLKRYVSIAQEIIDKEKLQQNTIITDKLVKDYIKKYMPEQK